MKTVGIIGGLGPETTAEFYLEIIFGCYQQNKKHRPPILLWNVPISYDVEQELLTKNSGEERYLPYLIDAAKRLEKAGADFLVMPCNTLHIFIEEIRKTVTIPMLSILEETTKFLKNKNITKVGLLATSSSLKHRLYEKSFLQNGIEQILPNDFDQAKIGKIISNIVLNRQGNTDREELLKIITKFKEKHVKNVILACTDLQLLIPHIPELSIDDTMKIFADATVDKILNWNQASHPEA